MNYNITHSILEHETNMLINNDLNNKKEHNSLENLLIIPSEKRSEKNCEQIAQFIQTIKFYSDYQKNYGNLSSLCKEIFLKEFPENTLIFSQGEIGDSFYTIYTGCVKISLNIPSSTRQSTKLKEITTLRPGDTFGESALFSDGIRNEIAITEGPSQLIILTKKIYDKYTSSTMNDNLSSIIKLYKYFPPFQYATEKEIFKLASKSSKQNYPSGTVLLRKGDYTDHIYMINSGRVDVVRKINFRIDPISKMIKYGDDNDPTPEEIKNNLYKSLLIEVDKLSTGNTFGDYAIFIGDSINELYITSVPCEIITFSIFDLKYEFSGLALTKYQALLKPYPNDNQIRKAYFDKNEWDQWKKKLMDNILFTKLNEKLGYSSQMRKPILKLHPINSIEANIDIILQDCGHKKILMGNKEKELAKKLKEVHEKTKSFSTFNRLSKNLQLPQSNQKLDSLREAELGIITPSIIPFKEIDSLKKEYLESPLIDKNSNMKKSESVKQISFTTPNHKLNELRHNSSEDISTAAISTLEKMQKKKFFYDKNNISLNPKNLEEALRQTCMQTNNSSNITSDKSKKTTSLEHTPNQQFRLNLFNTRFKKEENQKTGKFSRSRSNFSVVTIESIFKS